MKVSGKVVVLSLVLIAAGFGAALWYFRYYAYYHPVHLAGDPALETVRRKGGEVGVTTIRLTPKGGGAPVAVPVRDFRGIDAVTSPIKFRACFRIDMPFEALRQRFETTDDATPLVGPSWFTDCFDAARLTKDLEAGRATAFVGERGIHPGVDRIVLVYPDGRAAAWNQLEPQLRKEKSQAERIFGEEK